MIVTLLATIKASEYNGLDEDQSDKLMEIINAIGRCISLVMDYNQNQILNAQQEIDQ